MKSDAQLGLTPRWFTGKEWASGTAEKALQEEYGDALFKLEPGALTQRQQIHATMRRKGFKT